MRTLLRLRQGSSGQYLTGFDSRVFTLFTFYFQQFIFSIFVNYLSKKRNFLFQEEKHNLFKEIQATHDFATKMWI